MKKNVWLWLWMVEVVSSSSPQLSDFYFLFFIAAACHRSRLAHSYEGNVELKSVTDFNSTECEGINGRRTRPVYQYCHSRTNGNYNCTEPVAICIAVIWGFFYSGDRWPGLKGTYLFADFQGATIYGLQLNGTKVIDDFQLAVGKEGGGAISISFYLLSNISWVL